MPRLKNLGSRCAACEKENHWALRFDFLKISKDHPAPDKVGFNAARKNGLARFS
jgi:hypothetical protein